MFLDHSCEGGVEFLRSRHEQRLQAHADRVGGCLRPLQEGARVGIVGGAEKGPAPPPPTTSSHADFVTEAWVRDALKVVLRRIAGFSR